MITAPEVSGIEGGGWKCVRSVSALWVWHPSTDRLVGIDEYFIDDDTWSISFHQLDFDEFLFTFGDFSDWIVASRSEVAVNRWQSWIPEFHSQWS